MSTDTRPTVTGTCLCHGIDVTGPAGTVASPAPFLTFPDLFTGKRVRVVHVVDEEHGGMPHDIPTTEAAVIVNRCPACDAADVPARYRSQRDTLPTISAHDRPDGTPCRQVIPED